MAATALSPHSNSATMRSTLHNTTSGQPSWYSTKADYVVPGNQLKVYVEGIRDRILGRQAPNPEGRGGEGWQEILTAQVSLTLGVERVRVIRRLYDLMNDRMRICPAELAEAILMFEDMTIDHNTTLPTLPGNKWSCLDLLCVRAELLDPDVEPISLVKFIPEVMLLSAAIVESPEQTSQLQDDAPFDCLRPWRAS